MREGPGWLTEHLLAPAAASGPGGWCTSSEEEAMILKEVRASLGTCQPEELHFLKLFRHLGKMASMKCVAFSISL